MAGLAVTEAQTSRIIASFSAAGTTPVTTWSWSRASVGVTAAPLTRRLWSVRSRITIRTTRRSPRDDEHSPMGQRILILSASSGGGHLRAAEAIELALRQSAPGAEVVNHDVLRLSNRLFRFLYGPF